MFALFVLKTGAFFVFLVFENLFLPAERRGKHTKNAKKFVKNWSKFVAQHTWTSYQFSTQYVFFCAAL